MSSLKDKYLASALKNIQKGQLDRAIKDYEQIVQLEPGALQHRQKLAELFARVGRIGEAVHEYEEIGKFYDKNGFYLKAIAVFKQVQKLDPKNLQTCYTLAELNEKQGLHGNALVELKPLYDHYERSGQSAEMVKILQKMLDLDPQNVNVHIKLAETHLSLGLGTTAYDEYLKIAAALQLRGDQPLFERVCQRISVVFPDRQEFVLDLLEKQLQRSELGVAPRLVQFLQKHPDHLRALQMLVEAYGQSGDHNRQREVLRRLVVVDARNLGNWLALADNCLAGEEAAAALVALEAALPLCQAEEELTRLDKLLIALRGFLPEELRVLQLQHQLFSQTDDPRLAEVEARIEELRPRPVAQPLPEPEPEPAAVVAPPQPAAAAGEWEEEVDLDLDLDLEPSPATAPAVEEVLEEVAEVETLEDEEVSEEVRLAVDLDLPGELDATLVSALAGDEVEELAELELLEEEEPELLDVEVLLQEEAEQFNQVVEEVAKPVDTSDIFSLDELDVLGAVEEEGLDIFAPPAPAEDRELLAPLPPAEEEELDLAAIFGSAPKAVAPGESKYRLDSVLEKSRQKIREKLKDEDLETHYNLGIAYKEMGLYDDAIERFELVAEDPQRCIDALTLMGICYRDKGEVENAAQVFRETLDIGQLTEEELKTVQYELALTSELLGQKGEAQRLFAEIHRRDPEFRDVARRVSGPAAEDDFPELDLLDAELDKLGS